LLADNNLKIYFMGIKLYSSYLKIFFLTFCFLLSSGIVNAQQKFIMVDQFGYRPDAVKTAVIKNPQLGSDKDLSFTPGTLYEVVDAVSGTSVFQGPITPFNGSATDVASGDEIWWFDFSEVSTEGTYYIVDAETGETSYDFRIAEDVYNEVLKHAVRMFFYQRAGFAKEAQYAGETWADGASHVGPLQDKNCRLYNRKNDVSTERDLHGGWYDAGDYNKYTNWTCNYIESMLHAYLENPEIWTDDYNIPESGNGIPDLLDEVKWGMDWVLRMQEEDGSVLSIVSLGHASPPSAATQQSVYGPATTMASFSAAKAFAMGYKVYELVGLTEYAEVLKEAAIKAWNWAEGNPDVTFPNNSSSNGSSGVGAGNQEVGPDYDRQAIRITAALYLYEITGETSYFQVFENNYKKLPLFAWSNFVQQYWAADQFMFLKLLSVDGVSETVKNGVRTALTTGLNKSGDYIGKIDHDGYKTFILDYNWGSNKYKSDYGITFYLIAKYLDTNNEDRYLRVAEDYIHYIHGVNPLGFVYLTNMNNYGASNSLTQIYHAWFDHDSPQWDQVTANTPGPAPGYLAGGPNEDYTIDGCCPNGCGSAANNALCSSESVPIGDPPAKMYKDINNSWPINSWEITEPSGGYQVAYIRLLSKFVSKKENGGTGNCSLVMTGRKPEVYPNPAKDIVNIRSQIEEISHVQLYDSQMRLLQNRKINDNQVQLNTSSLPVGIYFLRIATVNQVYLQKILIR
jgi:hypothetical protein